MRLRSYLLLLATAVLVPGFLAAGIAVDKVREGEREAALRGLRETVRATALLVDGEIQRSLGAVTALGSSPHLALGELAGFYAQAHALDSLPDVTTQLLDARGQQLVNTRVPFGTPLPPPVAGDYVRRALASQRPVITDLVVGPVSHKLLTVVYAPASASSPLGPVVVAQAFTVNHWQRTVMAPIADSRWTVGVIDHAGRFISRNRNADTKLGQPARPELVAAAAQAFEGLIRHRTLEGFESYDAFTHSRLTGWTIAIAAPVDTIEASATQSVTWLALGVAAALAAALLLATLLSGPLIRGLGAAGATARALGRGQMPLVPPPRDGTPALADALPPSERIAVDELDVLQEALRDAACQLASERGARGQVEAERERLLDNERASREDAQRENAAKDQFLALLGHELRNPLAAIGAAAEVLSRGDAQALRDARFLAIIQRQHRHLRHIVDDLLEVSRMLSGKIELAVAPLDLAACVRHCVEALRAAGGDGLGGNGDALQLEADAPVWVAGDAVRLEQIVTNLAANALRFLPAAPAPRVVRLRVTREGDEAVLVVADTGPGIPPALLDRIFDPFVQGPPPAGGASSGLGIGLALVRQLVALHGGQVVASNPAEGGARFEVRMPALDGAMSGVAGRRADVADAADAAAAAAVDAAATADAAQSGASAAAPRSRVLLVEDNPDARETMSMLLEMLGYLVDTAADGPLALAAVARQRPDIVVMDLGLPGMDGHAVAAAMRAEPALRGLPLIALSGYGQDSDRQASAAAGFDAHLAKPVDPDVLAAEIEARLAAARAGQAPS